MLIASPLPIRRRLSTTPDFSGTKGLHFFQKDGLLRVGVSADMAPFSSRVGPNGAFEGLEVDLAKYLAIALFGCEPKNVMSYLEFVETKFADRQASLVEREVDVVLSVFADTPVRRKHLLFAGHYMAGKPALLLGGDCPPIKQMSDLNDIRVAVLDGSTGETKLRQLAPSSEMVVMATAPECVEAVRSKRVDAFWSSTAENTAYTHDPLTNFRQVSLDLMAEPWAFGLNQSSDDVARFINCVMGELLSASTLPRLMHKWLGSGFV